MEPDDVLVGVDERCGNEDERNQVFGREAAMLHFVEVAFDYESIENDLDEALDAAVVVQSDTLDKRADDADIRRVVVEQDKDAAVAHIKQLDRCQTAPMTDRMYWYDGAVMRGS